ISKACRLQTSNLLPKEVNIQRNLKTSQCHFYSTLKTYFRDEMKEYTTANGKQLRPVVIPMIYQLPQQKTIIYSFPCFDKNEAVISEVTEILHEIAEQMDLKYDDLRNKIVMYKGDWLTVRNIRYPSFNSWALME